MAVQQETCRDCKGRYPAIKGKARRKACCRLCGKKYDSTLPSEIDRLSRVRWTDEAVFIFTGLGCYQRRRSPKVNAYKKALRKAGFTGAIYHFDYPEAGVAAQKELSG